ncbi:hypothetical protein EDD11_006419 [Mortierella claussenii]|nr:hypothetical protein EDD11_006419 [Mortierella claussenii]
MRSSGSIRTAARGIQDWIAVHLAGVVSSKRRKSWFLSLILISVALTALSGGYLLNQLQHPHDLQGLLLKEGSPESDVQLDPGLDGPRRDRNRGKKHKASPKKLPQTSKAAAGKAKAAPNDPSSSRDKGKTKEEGTHAWTPAPESAPTGRICNLEDVASGRWEYTSLEAGAATAQDMSWTGYGRNGCRSNIWNEKYLLTPRNITGSTSSTTGAIGSSNGFLQRDLAYAQHLKGFRWHLIPRESSKKDKAQAQAPAPAAESQCRQPELDVGDFVEVLKRAPLVMIGDKFLEQEYLTIECMVLGLQDQILLEAGIKSGEDGKLDTDKETLEGLEYRIESEVPPVVELRVAPGIVSSSTTSARSTTKRPTLYRKAKPGLMRLVDRASNLTLVTFIRSDVLWDSEVLLNQGHKHTIKSAADLSNLEAGGLHPNCKLGGSILLCEPERITQDNRASTINEQDAVLKTSKHWWQWWVSTEDVATPKTLDDHQDLGDLGTNAEMLFGSDLDDDMINMGWVGPLDEIVQDAAEHRASALNRKDASTVNTDRTPVVIISNGRFWEFNPEDTNVPGKKVAKAEQDLARRKRDVRRKLLRQRYTMVLTNMLDYIKGKYPDLRVMVQSSVQSRSCENHLESEDETLRLMRDQEAVFLNALTKTVVARMQDPLYSFLDTTFLRVFEDSVAGKRHCSSFMMPGPLDTLVHHLYGELFRLDL